MMASEGEGKPIRIVHCIGSMQIGGTETQLAELIARLPPQRFEQSLVLIRATGPLQEKVREAGCEIHDLGYDQRFRLWNPLCYWRVIRTLARLIGILRRTRPDVLNAKLFWANVLCVLAGRLTGVRVIVASRVSLADYKSQRRLLQFVENLANRFTSAFAANSEAVRQDVLLHERIDPSKIQVIYNGVDTEAFQIDPDPALAKKIGLDPEDFVLVTIARLHPCKGHEDLLAALQKIKSDHPTIRAVLCGGDRGSETRLHELAKELDLEDNLIFLGERSDVSRLLALCDLVVHPSHEEGFSNAILEAMASGKPVVATDVGGAAEAILEGETGLLVPPHAPGDLAEAISKMASDRDRAASMGQAGRQRIQAEFSMETAANRFAEFYESLVVEAPRGERNKLE